MDIREKERLRFRRQYIIVQRPIVCPFQHEVHKLDGSFVLYTHIDLKFSETNRNGVRLILLGDILDWEFPEKSNLDILTELTESNYDLFLEKTSRYAGRFVIIHIYKGAIRMMHDATACRKIYYSNLGSMCCASQPHLLAHVQGISMTTNPEVHLFYSSDIFKHLNNANIGDLTCYEKVFQLLPNHYLNLNDSSVQRYWCNMLDAGSTFNATVSKCARMLSGYIMAISNRYNIMLPVTAGKDSRTLLAATRSIQNKVFYYVNNEFWLKPNSLDITLPQKMFHGLGLQFHVLDPYIKIDPDFREIYYENNPYACAYYLPHIYNYYLNFPDKVNLPGNFVASAYDMYGSFVKKVTPEMLATFNRVHKYQFAIDYYRRWLQGNEQFCKQNHINTMALFYWEERLANWGTQIQIDKDIAQEDLIPFNSRELIHCFLSVKPKFIDRPGFLFFKKIIGTLWPELLAIPTNPDFKNKLTKTLDNLGLLGIIRKSIFLYQIKIKSRMILKNKNRTVTLLTTET